VDKDNKRQTLKADTIIPAIPLRPDNRLFQSLEGKFPEVYAIGDCNNPGVIIDAMDAGDRIAKSI
jgi:2-enoate reductase